MPKRKRGAENDPVHLRKEEVEQKLAHCKKLLNKALKLAKGFERQKLGRRVKLAAEKSDEDDLKRLNREIDVIKTLNFSRAVDAHLYKTLLKSKSIAESPLLPDDVREIPKAGGDEEQILASNNVTARMYNSKPVKDVMSQIMTMMYITLEIPEPTNRSKGKKPKVDTRNVDRETKNVDSTSAKMKNTTNDEDNYDQDDHDMDSSEELAANGEESWEGFSGSEGEDGDSGSDVDNGDDFSLDEEQLSRYDALLGNSSEESDISDSENNQRESSFPPQEPSNPKRFLSISRSPSPLPSKPKSILKPSKTKPDLEPPKGSVFLPTLMGGYWSGTESEPSDTESLKGPQQRKNRRGQRERRKIAELKFGNRAKHLQGERTGNTGSSSRRDDRDKDWDMKRGARLSTDVNAGPRNRKERRMGGDKGRRVGRDNRQMTGENAIPVGERVSGSGESGNGNERVKKAKDDDGKKGVNHPSWQAAKKAKEVSHMATFQGTKVKFS